METPFRLDGRKALVTGGASGIGEATVRVLSDAGATVTKIEPPGGEWARQRGPKRTGTDGREVSSYFAAVNRGSQVLDSIHSHVRRFKMQAQIFVARVQALRFWPPMGMAGGVIISTTVDQTLMRGSEPHDL